MTHEQYRKIFRIIDESLWGTATHRNKDGWVDGLDKRSKSMEAEAERIQRNIAVYIQRQTAMLTGLIQDTRFSKFPLPRKRMPALLRLQARFSLWKASRIWRVHGPADCGSHQSQNDRTM